MNGLVALRLQREMKQILGAFGQQILDGQGHINDPFLVLPLLHLRLLHQALQIHAADFIPDGQHTLPIIGNLELQLPVLRKNSQTVSGCLLLHILQVTGHAVVVRTKHGGIYHRKRGVLHGGIHRILFLYGILC